MHYFDVLMRFLKASMSKDNNSKYVVSLFGY